MGDAPLPSTLPPDNAGYLQLQYWEKRFEAEEEYEWFRSYEHFRPLVEREARPDDRVLVVGCGNSSLSEDMYRLSGLRNICSTDASQTVIERMSERAAARCPGITWAVADLLALPFADASFDVVIEKGVIDCFMVDNKDPWKPAPEVRARVATVLRECHRVLSPRGVLLSVTFAGPHFRKPLLQDGAFTWRCAHDYFGSDDAWHYSFYAMRKGLKQPHEADEPEQQQAVQHEPRESMLHEHMDDESFLMGALLDDDDPS